MSDQPTTGSWELSPFRRSVLVIAVVVAVVIAVVGATTGLSARGGPTTFTVVWLVFWLAACGLILSRFVRSVTRLDIRADGRIEARRLIGTITTDARLVRSIGRSVWGQNNSRPVTIRTVEGKVLLANGFPSVFDVATAIRAHNPAVDVDL